MRIITIVFLSFIVCVSCKKRDEGAISGNPTGADSYQPGFDTEHVVSGSYQIDASTEIITERKLSGTYVIEGVLND